MHLVHIDAALLTIALEAVIERSRRSITHQKENDRIGVRKADAIQTSRGVSGVQPRVKEPFHQQEEQEAANLMIQKRQHRVIVVDKNETNGFPLGLVSSFDIVTEMARPGSVWQEK